MRGCRSIVLGRAVAVACLLGGSALPTRAAELPSPRVLLKPVSAEVMAARSTFVDSIKARPGFRRARVAAVERAAFEGSKLNLPLFPDITVEAEQSDIGFTGVEGKTWTGKLPNGGSAAFIIRGDRVAGSIATPQGNFQVLPLDGGLCVVVERDFGDRDDCGAAGERHRPDAAAAAAPVNPKDTFGPVTPRRALAGRGDARLADTPTGNRVRVLVAYTADARNLTTVNLGMTMQELIDLAILESNQGYANSGVTLRIELACLYQTVFNETAAIENDVDTFRNNGDGVMDEVHTLRSDYDADMCALIIDGTDPDWCGWAYGFDYTAYSNMFQATVYDCATGRFTFAHEFGHNQGCRHDNDGTLTPFAYGHGFRNGNNWRTIMAVSGGNSAPRLNYWSNPNINSPMSPFTAMGTAINGGNFANDNRAALNASDNSVVDHESTPLDSVAPSGDDFGTDEAADKIVTGTLSVTSFTANSGSRVQFRAGTSVTLGAGFWARSGSIFRARLAGPLGDANPTAGDAVPEAPQELQGQEVHREGTP